MSFKSATTHLLHVIFGLPLFLFQGGFHLRHFLVMFSDVYILRTCPTHFNRLVCISVSIFWHPVFLYRTLLEILFGQKSFAILRRQVLWKEFKMVTSVLKFLHSGYPRYFEPDIFWSSSSYNPRLGHHDQQNLAVSLDNWSLHTSNILVSVLSLMLQRFKMTYLITYRFNLYCLQYKKAKNLHPDHITSPCLLLYDLAMSMYQLPINIFM